MKKIILLIEKQFEMFTERIAIILGHSVTFFAAIIIVICWITLDIVHSRSLHGLINDLIFLLRF